MSMSVYCRWHSNGHWCHRWSMVILFHLWLFCSSLPSSASPPPAPLAETSSSLAGYQTDASRFHALVAVLPALAACNACQGENKNKMLNVRGLHQIILWHLSCISGSYPVSEASLLPGHRQTVQVQLPPLRLWQVGCNKLSNKRVERFHRLAGLRMDRY